MPRALHKVQKRITKKKGKGTALHAKSRDSRALLKASARDDRLYKAASVRQKGMQNYLERVQFFQERAENMDWPSVNELVKEYMERDSEELVRLRDNRREGRPPTTREQVLAQVREQDTAEFAGGFWLPDLTDASNVALLKQWTGEWTALSIIKFVYLTADGVAKPAPSFPNKG